MKMVHHITQEDFGRGLRLTVDDNGDDLGEDEAVLPNEGWDLSKEIVLEIIRRRRSTGGRQVDVFDIELVEFGNHSDGSRASIVLLRFVNMSQKISKVSTYAFGVDFSEAHFGWQWDRRLRRTRAGEERTVTARNEKL
jgi:hypothetical protein